MSEVPLLEGVLKYTKENNISFCTPGHKGGRGFTNTPIGKEFLKNFLKCDITEVEGADNLHNAEGIIKEASKLLKNFYGSRKSYFLVNGSTSGNLVMIFSSFKEGDKVLVDRNCHKSVFNAIIMKKLQPIYIKNIISGRFDIPLSIDLEHLLQVLENNKDAKGVIVTYPNYYGICSDLEYIIKKSKEYNMKVLVDCAHGAHFGVHEHLPKSAVALGADMVVTSTHKTLSSLTQTAYLHVNNGQDIGKVDFYISAFSSTSPSYLFLCSMDYARFYLQKYGKQAYGKLLDLTNYYREKINTIDGIHIIGKDDIEIFDKDIYEKGENNKFRTVLNLDTTRYVINLDKKYSGHLLLRYLRKNGVQAEMSDGSNVVLIFSTFNEEWEFEKLYYILKNCNIKELEMYSITSVKCNIPEMKLLPCEVVNKEKTWADLDSCLGKISADNIIPYPPGVPILTMGEVIDEECLSIIKYYVNNKVDILGVKSNAIQIVSQVKLD